MRDLSNELRVIQQTAGTCYFGTCRLSAWTRVRRSVEAAAGNYLAVGVLTPDGKPDGWAFVCTALPSGLKRGAPLGREGWSQRGVMVWSGSAGCCAAVWLGWAKSQQQGAIEVSRGWSEKLRTVEGAGA